MCIVLATNVLPETYLIGVYPLTTLVTLVWIILITRELFKNDLFVSIRSIHERITK